MKARSGKEIARGMENDMEKKTPKDATGNGEKRKESGIEEDALGVRGRRSPPALPPLHVPRLLGIC